jgi:hypothetical protein
MKVITIAAGILLAYAVMLFAAMPALLLLVLMLAGVYVGLLGLVVVGDGTPVLGYTLLAAGAAWNCAVAWAFGRLRQWQRD